MTRIRVALGRVRSAVAAPGSSVRRWWDDFDSPQGQIATMGLLLLGAGLAFVWFPLALIVPGVVLTAIGMGFDLRRRGG